MAADTRVIWETRSPTWDQTLIFKDCVIWGDVNETANNPPTIVCEIFDKDIGVREVLLKFELFSASIANFPVCSTVMHCYFTLAEANSTI